MRIPGQRFRNKYKEQKAGCYLEWKETKSVEERERDVKEKTLYLTKTKDAKFGVWAKRKKM